MYNCKYFVFALSSSSLLQREQALPVIIVGSGGFSFRLGDALEVHLSCPVCVVSIAIPLEYQNWVWQKLLVTGGNSIVHYVCIQCVHVVMATQILKLLTFKIKRVDNYQLNMDKYCGFDPSTST